MINNSENTVGNNLVNDIADIKRTLREGKTSLQRIGAESLTVGSLPTPPGSLYIFGPYTLLADQNGSLTIHFTAGVSPIQTLWNFQYALYVDVHDSAHRFPLGASLTSGQLTLTSSGYDNESEFDSTTQIRGYTVEYWNRDSVTHNYYVGMRAFLPLTLGGGGS